MESKSAFNVDLIGDFSRELVAKDFFDALFDLKITNVYRSNEKDVECYAEIASQLTLDYWNKSANAFSYLREGMDARELWELRKSAVLWDYFEHERFRFFFDEHLVSWTYKQIKEYRSHVLSKRFVDYEDHDWQYFWVLKYALTNEQMDRFRIVGEELFADRDLNKPDDLGDPIADMAWYAFPVDYYKPKIIH